MKESPFYKLTGDHNCEINGLKMSQNLIAVSAWMLAIMQEKPAIVIEIGTGSGGFSSLLSHTISVYGGKLITMDTSSVISCFQMHGRVDRFFECDCFKVDGFIRARMGDAGKCFLLCDGGNKEKEWNTFAPFLKPGDVIGVHDWINPSVENFCPDYWSWSEVNLSNLDWHGFELFMPEWFDKSAWFVRQKV